MSIADDKPRRRRLPVFGVRRKASRGAEEALGAAEGDAPDAVQDAPPVLSARMRAMLGTAAEDGPEASSEDGPAEDDRRAATAPDAVPAEAVSARAEAPTSRTDAAPLRAARELRPAISEPEEPESCAPAMPKNGAPAAARDEESDPDAPGNRAISLAIRLGSMMGVVLAGVFVATLVDLALGLKTRFQGLGVLATYLVVLAVILAPSLNPRTRRQWHVVIGGFAGVIFAIALGSAVARLMLQTKDFHHTGVYVHMAVEFGVMFAFWGLASLVFVEVLRSAGIKIGGGPDDPS